MVAAVMAEPAHRPPPPLFRSIVLDPMRAFAGLEAAGGIVLFGAALLAFGLANSPWHAAFERVWTTPVELRFGPVGFGFQASFSGTNNKPTAMNETMPGILPM